MKHFNYREGELFCEGVPARSLAEKYGTPLYVYSRNSFLDAYRDICRAFAKASPLVAFSVKSCSNLAILNILREAGAGFDIVSGGELHRVVKVGADPRKVVFSGVGKSDPEILQALDQDILMFNVESEAELDNLQAMSAGMGTVAPVALRLNPDVDAHTHAKTTTGKKENKFGIDFSVASRIIRNIAEQPNIRLLGLDVHLGSPIYSTLPYRQALAKLTDFIKEHRSPRAHLEYLNIGGGYGLLYRDQAVPSFQEYADAIIPFIGKTGCKLILEPGRSLSGNGAVLLSRVLYTKNNGTRHFTIVDAGMSDLVRPAMYDAYHFCWPTQYARTPPAELFGSPEAKDYLNRETGEDWEAPPSGAVDAEGFRLTDVVGPICESSDCFTRGRRLPVLERGDLISFFSAGAYGFSMSSNYNSRPRPAEVLVNGGESREIRKRETLPELTAGEAWQ
ncbi:MAG: diaminopimelate decarboxylase [Planctomycetota bacterium]|jgi:diaminopimelate decarboxylase|nr:diaminopimelate decarboxylase [Planctomycetota bacterium]